MNTTTISTTTSMAVERSTEEHSSTNQNITCMDPDHDGEDPPNMRHVVPEDSTTSDDDLTKSYDIVICGTGLVQSILASSLALVGKSVLHCDSQDIYGELDASYGLTDLISWVEQHHHHQQQQPQKDCRRGYNYHPNTLNVSTADTNNTTTVHPKGSLATLHIHSYRQSWTQEEAQQSRKFVLDLMPTTTNTNDTAATLATATSTNSAGSSIIDTINERNVQELGMSLRRPQNKPMNKSSLDQLLALAPTSSSFYYYSQPSLKDYLQSQFQIPTSSFLSQVILHALCLQHSTQQYLPVTKGIDTLVRHVSSLGKYVDTTSLTTSTAFIAPLYGTSELVQGFCRSCAVHGGVYMLRTTMESIRYGGSPSSNNGIMVSGTILTQGAQESNDKDTATHSTTVHFPISCKHVVVPQDAMLLPPDDDETGRANSTTTKILRRTCVIRGTLILPNQQQRSIAIIPPLTQGISNTDAIFIHDSKSCTEEQVPSPSQSAPQEILQATFSISANDDNWLKYGRGSTTGESNQQVRGLHVCKRPHLAITVDEAFEEAERIFHDIMNDTETDTVNPPKFLKMSNEVRQQVMKNVIGIRNEDIVDDNEKDILASAMDLIGSPNRVEHSNMDQQVDSNILIPFD